jgi:N-acetylglutamate synthase-like GNAT family acetyltransferase
MKHTIRKATANDTAAVMDIIRRTKFFRPVEEEIAQEFWMKLSRMRRISRM